MSLQPDLQGQRNTILVKPHFQCPSTPQKQTFVELAARMVLLIALGALTLSSLVTGIRTRITSTLSLVYVVG